MERNGVRKSSRRYRKPSQIENFLRRPYTECQKHTKAKRYRKRYEKKYLTP